MGFFNAITLTRSLGQCDVSWPKLFTFGIERIQITHGRLSDPGENEEATWTSGASTLSTLSGVNWQRRQYPKLTPRTLLRGFHDESGRVYSIGETELASAIWITALWGEVDNPKQAILPGAGNRNVFSRIDNRTAKTGISLRMVAALHVRWVKQGIEVYPFCIRRLRNARPDFITSASVCDIDHWAYGHQFAKIDMRWRRNRFARCSPLTDWAGGRVANFPKPLETRG